MRVADHLLMPWFDRLRKDVGGLDLFDAHTHVGQNDPDGMKQTSRELFERLAVAGARALVFPMHEPDGYPAANDFVGGEAAQSDGKLAWLCRVDPKLGDAAVAEAKRCLDAGAAGIKLHPRAEQFGMDAPAVEGLVQLADERRRPILIHAGRGIPALGRHTVELATRHPNARFILAHAAISDIAWLWKLMPEHPNLFIDTSWWNPSDLLTLFRLVPPGQVLWASDSPYGTPIQGAILTLRAALQCGLAPEQVEAVAGGQLERIIAGEDTLDLGPGPRDPRVEADVLLERLADNLVGAMHRLVVGDSGEEPLALARLACAVGEDSARAEVCMAILELLDRYDLFRAEVPEEDRAPFSEIHIITCALSIARTPDVPLPHVPGEPPPEREAIPA